MSYADKARTLEFMIVMLDEVMADIKRHLHYAAYQIYDETKCDTDFMKDRVNDLREHVEELEKIYDDEIPEEQKRIDYLEKENKKLKEECIKLSNIQKMQI